MDRPANGRTQLIIETASLSKTFCIIAGYLWEERTEACMSLPTNHRNIKSEYFLLYRNKDANNL